MTKTLLKAPHRHVVFTIPEILCEKVIGKSNVWKRFNHINYQGLRKSWMFTLLKRLSNKIQVPFFKALVDKFYETNDKGIGKALYRAHAYRIIRTAGKSISLPGRISCHSLRKTFGYHAWKKGTSPAVLMEIFNHSSLAVTRRYLGICQDDLNVVYMSMVF